MLDNKKSAEEETQLPERQSRTSLAVFLIIFLSIFLSSCVTTEQLPSDWQAPDLSAKQGCGDISGTYLNIGEASRKGNPYYKPNLANYLFLPSRYGHIDADRVVIIQKEQEEIEVTALKGNKIVTKKSLLRSSDGFSCKEGMFR